MANKTSSALVAPADSAARARDRQGPEQPVPGQQGERFAALREDAAGHDGQGCLTRPQTAQQQGAEGETGRVDRKGPPEASGGGDHPGDGGQQDLSQHRGGPDPAVRGDQLLLRHKFGSREPAAGLKNTVPADRPNATPYTMAMSRCHTASTAANTIRTRSAIIITATRGSRSTTAPAIGVSSSTGAISATTAPDNPTPDPVNRNTSSAKGW